MPLSSATPTPITTPDLFLAFIVLAVMDRSTASIYVWGGPRLLGLRVRTPAAFAGSISCVNCGV